MKRTSQIAYLSLFLFVFAAGCSEKRSVAPQAEPTQPTVPTDETTTALE